MRRRARIASSADHLSKEWWSVATDRRQPSLIDWTVDV